MSESRKMLLMLKGCASDLPAEQVAKVNDARDRIRAIISEGEEAVLGMAIVSAEIAIDQEGN